MQELDIDESEVNDVEVIDSAERMELRDDIPREYQSRYLLYLVVMHLCTNELLLYIGRHYWIRFPIWKAGTSSCQRQQMIIERFPFVL